MDRATLVRQRKQIRVKENVVAETNSLLENAKTAVVEKTIDQNDPTESDTTLIKGKSDRKSREQTEAADQAPPPPPVMGKRAKRSSKQSKSSTATYSNEANAGLVVRQILQRSQFGDVKEYLLSITKPELFQQALVVATYVQELKKKHSEVSEAVEAELVEYQSKYRSIASDLAEREQKFEEQENKKNELLGRLKLAQDEHQSLLSWIREHEDKFKALQQTKQDQTQLIEEMTKIRRQREEQLDTIEKEREEAFRFAEELQGQNSKLQADMVMIERDCERLQADLIEEQASNKKLLLEAQQKTQMYVANAAKYKTFYVSWAGVHYSLEQISSELENARNQISTLHGQVQLEAMSRHSVTHERDRIQQQYAIDRQDWKSTQERRNALEKRKADEFRKMDLELRHLNQALSRMRIEWESEKSQRDKSDARLQKLAQIIDGTKTHTNTLEEENQQLKTQLNEEQEVRTNKDHALQIAHRDLQALQKNCRELENAKLDAQSEVVSLVQRMKVIRRDHLALLHRVEAPTQLAAQWHTKMQADDRSLS